jgi:plasmid stabilization system protein ParE
MRPTVLTDSALRDIDGIWDDIAAESPGSADRLIENVYREILRIGTSPHIGHTRIDLVAEKTLLFWAVAGYLIVYRTQAAETTILAVLHGSRDIPAVLRERG